MIQSISRSQRQSTSFSLPMVAFIDVIFLLFTFFTLTMRYQIEGELGVKTPKWSGLKQQQTAEQKELEIVRVFLSGQGRQLTIMMQDQPVADLDELYGRLNSLPKDIPVILDGHPSVAYKNMIRVYNHCLKAQLKQVAFAVHPNDPS